MLDLNEFIDHDSGSPDELEMAICQSLNIDNAEHNVYKVPASNGQDFYEVKFTGSPELSVNTYECNCPAGLHGKMCKHVKMVASINNFVCNEWGME